MVILILNKEKNEWQQISPEEKATLPPEMKAETLTISSKLKQKLDFGLKQQQNDDDVMVIIDGKEGTGKSSLAGEIMRYITKDTFDPKKDMIGSDYEDALEKIDNVKKGGCLMFDEGNAFFMSTDTTKKETRELHKIFSIFRQLNLFVIICLPSFFRMASYFASDRPKFLCTTYKHNGERGRYCYYGEKRLAKFYAKGRKEAYNRQAIKPQFRARFNKCICLENPEYKKFKLKTLKMAISKARTATKAGKPPTPREIESKKIDDIILKNPDKTSEELGKFLGLTGAAIRFRRIKLKKSKDLQKNDENNT